MYPYLNRDPNITWKNYTPSPTWSIWPKRLTLGYLAAEWKERWMGWNPELKPCSTDILPEVYSLAASCAQDSSLRPGQQIGEIRREFWSSSIPRRLKTQWSLWENAATCPDSVSIMFVGQCLAVVIIVQSPLLHHSNEMTVATMTSQPRLNADYQTEETIMSANNLCKAQHRWTNGMQRLVKEVCTLHNITCVVWPRYFLRGWDGIPTTSKSGRSLLAEWSKYPVVSHTYIYSATSRTFVFRQLAITRRALTSVQNSQFILSYGICAFCCCKEAVSVSSLCYYCVDSTAAWVWKKRGTVLNKKRLRYD